MTLACSRDRLQPTLLPEAEGPPVDWRASAGYVDYETAVAEMEAHVARMAAGDAPERVWLLEHPPVYTAGTSAKESDLLDARFPVHRTGRGGQFTYHGPGQRVAYVMLDLTRRRRDARAYVCALESWLIGSLADFGVTGERREARVGVWVKRPDKPCGPAGEIAEDKIAAIGVRLRQWISFHGVALNVAPDLSHFTGITPCGVRDSHLGVTSLADLGVAADMAEVDATLRRRFAESFGPVAVS
ncbi:lipoyl(octanoyl) transferase LipB [Methylocystis echinoides]|uniref:Octanoyltransferase n=1 Tax=Methylocystis echinoides TaxID=29468 RepID=A0A9W6GT68_9HYPH|nr:lipoyl(octanoyl) transferase LipB [Methylocystis echinoides]GLI92470.1 octanoyltransferase [Methylocystis echinoides]